LRLHISISQAFLSVAFFAPKESDEQIFFIFLVYPGASYCAPNPATKQRDAKNAQKNRWVLRGYVIFFSFAQACEIDRRDINKKPPAVRAGGP
jgi:hypothetical protein